MLRPRIIPCLLVHKGGLVKTQQFANPKYVGDPINAVRIFNEKEADELIVLDIDATTQSKGPNFALIEKLAAECRMPLCYGGGVKSPEQVAKIIDLGVEKVAVSSIAVQQPEIISKMSEAVGRQSIVVVIDYRKKRGIFAKGLEVCTINSTVIHNFDPIDLALTMQEAGAGEIVFNSIDNDGMMVGYDLNLAERARQGLSIPFTMLGGAGKLEHMTHLFSKVGVVGAAAGSLFVFKGQFRAVLISYPTATQIDEMCRSS